MNENGSAHVQNRADNPARQGSQARQHQQRKSRSKSVWDDIVAELGEELETREQKRAYIRSRLARNHFDWLVVAVAGSGFFTDSFNLFCVNVTLPILAKLYWDSNSSDNIETIINCLTLAGSLVGQILFGILTDLFGRQRLYGIELVVVVFATIGVVQSSYGYVDPATIHQGDPTTNGELSIQAQLYFWRFIMGVGIGAEYPLSAVITAEWSATESRARMMATVFFMQPLGQLCAALTGLWVLLGQSNTSGVSLGSLDKIWRIVSAIGMLPALIALAFRFTIKDPGRWTLDVKNEGEQAVVETVEHPWPSSALSSQESLVLRRLEQPPESGNGETRNDEAGNDEARNDEARNDEAGSYQVDAYGTDDEDLPEQFSRHDLEHYFITQGNWRYLFATSTCWFLLDFAFFGIGMNNPKTLATFWRELPATSDLTALRQLLLDDAKRSIITISIGSLLGVLALIVVINRVSRRRLLVWSFFALGVLFICSSITFLVGRQTNVYIFTIVLLGLCHFLFNFGPNTLTFIIPAEIFATRYRGTCHGISAAAGKLGSIFVQIIFFKQHAWMIRNPADPLNPNDPDPAGLGWLLLIFAFVMGIGALVAWLLLPELQTLVQGERNERRWKSKSLEELADGL